MTVPRGATRSIRQARPSRLRRARRFLPSWSREFDSRRARHLASVQQRDARRLEFDLRQPPTAACQSG